MRRARAGAAGGAPGARGGTPCASEPTNDRTMSEASDIAGRRSMTGYIIRRILWGIALLVLVCALTFVLFRVIPTGNPAVLRAGRDPQPKLIHEIERVLGLNKPLTVQFWDYIKNVLLHFNLGYSYYSQESVQSADHRTPAADDLARGRRGGAVGRRRVSASGIISGAAQSLADRPHGDGDRADARLGARILARPGRALSCSPTTSASGRSSPAPAATCRSRPIRGAGSPR